ncbi:hypothetical protein I9W82_003166 [Candida metapsilosis]|uniref:Uncharacterized protein n=1 Tax=Candida metapsilosis TaxID=273372 RepID=A0A8H7ZFV8_9ASCO|nr:hypothetical protein I9W82_003166 [Candida metapsilosis]
MLSFHAAKSRSGSRESTATTTTTRHLSIPGSLPNRVLLVKQFTIGTESDLTKPLALPKHVTKVINQLKQADPTKSVASDTTDTTKSVDPVTITNPYMVPDVQNTTAATSINQTSTGYLHKLNLSDIENQPVETTRNCVSENSSPSENLWEKTFKSVDNHTKGCEIRNEVVRENDDPISIHSDVIVPAENIHGEEKEEKEGVSAAAIESRVEQAATDQSTENDIENSADNSTDNSTGQVINESKGKWKKDLKQKWTRMFTRSPSKPQLNPPSKSKFSKKVKKWFNVGKKIGCPDDEGYEETDDDDDEGDDDLNVPIWDIEPVPIDNPRAYFMKRRINAAFEKVSKPFKKGSSISDIPQSGREQVSKGAVIARMKDKCKFWRKQKKGPPKKSPATGTSTVGNRKPLNQERDGAGVDAAQSLSNPIVATNSKPDVKFRNKWRKVRDSFKAGFARTFRRKRKAKLATDDNSLLFDAENGNVRDDKASEEEPIGRREAEGAEGNVPAEEDDEDIENLDSFCPASHDEILDIDPETGQFFGSHGFLDEYYSPKKIKLKKVKSKSLGSSILKRRCEEATPEMTVPTAEKSQSGHWVLDPDKGWIFEEVANHLHWVLDPERG